MSADERRRTRRDVLAALGTMAVLPIVASAAQVAPPLKQLPRPLQPGMTVAVVCPASGVMASEIRDFVALMNSWKINVTFGKNVNRRLSYLAAEDSARAQEFMDAVLDPSVDAIICGRGGYGVMRILPMLDFGAIQRSNKLIMGFSDITALLIAVEQLSGLVTYHGPVASSGFDAFTTSAMKSITYWDGKTATTPPPAFHGEAAETLVPGYARGRLTGGNLAMIVSTLGTRYEIDTTDSILFLEEISEEPYRVDRMLTQLWLAGKLQSCRGLMLGNFRDCEAKSASPLGPSPSLRAVLDDRIVALGIPAVYGMPFGHVRSKMTIPLGIRAELDAKARRLRLLDPPIDCK